MDDIDENDSMFEAEILPRLRLNTLQSCKLVSKTWLDHIKSPYFFYYHLEKSIQNHHLNLIFFGHNNTNSVETFDAENLVPSVKTYDCFDLPSVTGTFRIVGSCNGLLCFKSTDIRDECGNLSYNFVLYNPVTRVEKSFRVLPVFNLENKSCNLGFGFTCDNKNMDYKLVFITGQEIHVYSLKTLSWKRIGDYPCKDWLWKTPEEHEARGVPTDNAIHWLSGKQLGEKSIFSIDLNNGGQQFETPLNDTRTPKLVTLGGRLHLIFTRSESTILKISQHRFLSGKEVGKSCFSWCTFGSRRRNIVMFGMI
ncbi:F-box/kelch-repeat protein At3g06240-like isoform X2 [Spinacia oleracea]|uniref:F-box/kelch-repeat protein At3g06240-like isoform X2 n=1 Tax=Spinacia oleracea TaxID=3562 RepID=A0ABM3R019_SPIOL|nr:F-box/kelch-repeat protein At3g06240-like isoform X2 [Spinacia oleracea]